MESADVKKYPLENKWVLYFNKGGPGAGSKAYSGPAYREVYTFDNVEDFCRLYNTIKKPSDLPIGSTYFLFKQGIKPEWEDEANIKGGNWNVTPTKDQLSDAWLNCVLAVIGEQFKCGEEINGISINIRKRDRIEVWTRTSSDESKQVSIGKQLKEFLDLDSRPTYTSFDDKMKNVMRDLYSV